jgi:hypothetical protein
MRTPHSLAATLLLLLALASPTWAEQVSNWSSTSGSRIQMVGSQNMNFTIIITNNQGTQAVAQARWISTQVPKSFSATYPDGSSMYGHFVDDYTIQIDLSTGQTVYWKFVNFVSR